MRRDERVEVRVSAETLDDWQAEAKARGSTLSELIRFAVDRECGRLAILNSEERHPAGLDRDEVTPLFRDERKGRL